MNTRFSKCILLPVQCIEGFFTTLNITLKGLLLGVHPDMDFQAVGCQKGLPTTLLIAHKGVLPTVGLLVGAQVACSAVGTRAALKCALVALHLSDKQPSFESMLA